MRPGRVGEQFGLFGGGAGQHVGASLGAAVAASEMTGRVAGGVADAVWDGVGIIDGERRLKQEQFLRDDKASFYELETGVGVAREAFRVEEGKLNGAPGREGRWREYAKGVIVPLVSGTAWKTAEVESHAKLYVDRVIRSGGVEEAAVGQRLSLDREKRAFGASYEAALKEGAWDKAEVLVRSVQGDLMLPEEVDGHVRDIGVRRVFSDFLERSAKDPFAARNELEGGVVKGLPLEWQLKARRAVEGDLDVARGVRKDGYVAQVFEGVSLDVERMREDVKEGRLDAGAAISLEASEVRRQAAIKEGNSKRLECYTDPAGAVEFEAAMVGYSPDADDAVERLNDLENILVSGQFSKVYRETAMADLKAMKNGELPVRLRGLSGQLRESVAKMMDNQAIVEWKGRDGRVSQERYREALRVQFDLLKVIDDGLRANSKATFADGERWIGEFLTRGGKKVVLRAPKKGDGLKREGHEPWRSDGAERGGVPSRVGDAWRGGGKSGGVGSGSGGGVAALRGDFEEAGKEWGVDPKLLEAISMFETGSGTSSAFRNKNNAMGVSPNGGGPRAFKSARDSIFYMAQRLATNPAYKGKKTIDEIGAVYAPVGAGNDPHGTNGGWAAGVRKFYKGLTRMDDVGSSALSKSFGSEVVSVASGVGMRGKSLDGMQGFFLKEMSKRKGGLSLRDVAVVNRVVADKWLVDNK